MKSTQPGLLLLLPVLAGCAAAPDIRCHDVVPAGSNLLRSVPSGIAAPSGLLNTPASFVDFWYVTPHYELVLCRYDAAKPACADRMSGATFVRQEEGWRHQESYDLVCSSDD